MTTRSRDRPERNVRLPLPHPHLRQGSTAMSKWRLEPFPSRGECTILAFCYCVNLLPYCNLSQAPLTNLMFLLSYHDVLNRSCASAALRLRVFHASAPRLSLPIPPALSSLETKADTASAREWLNAFRIATVPRNMVELSFARSSGPGGQVRVFPWYIAKSHLSTFRTP